MACLPLSFPVSSRLSASVPCPAPAHRAPAALPAVLPAVLPVLLLLVVLFQFFLSASPVSAQERIAAFARQLQSLEYAHGARIALAAHEVHSGRTLFFRASERVPFCSTFKVFLVAEILHRADVLTRDPQPGAHVRVQPEAQARNADQNPDHTEIPSCPFRAVSEGESRLIRIVIGIGAQLPVMWPFGHGLRRGVHGADLIDVGVRIGGYDGLLIETDQLAGGIHHVDAPGGIDEVVDDVPLAGRQQIGGTRL